MINPVSKFFSTGPSKAIVSAPAESEIVTIPRRENPYEDDQFLYNSGTFAFDARLKSNQEAGRIADTIWSVVSPLTRRSCSSEEKLAYLLFAITNGSERHKKRKMEELRLIGKQDTELQKRREENSKQTTAQTAVVEERLKGEQDVLKTHDRKINDELQQISQRAVQETQILSGLTSSLHEAIMSAMRQA